jgi:hypothetical protein
MTDVVVAAERNREKAGPQPSKVGLKDLSGSRNKSYSDVTYKLHDKVGRNVFYGEYLHIRNTFSRYILYKTMKYHHFFQESSLQDLIT